jgi:hypothetical protein
MKMEEIAKRGSSIGYQNSTYISFPAMAAIFSLTELMVDSSSREKRIYRLVSGKDQTKVLVDIPFHPHSREQHFQKASAQNESYRSHLLPAWPKCHPSANRLEAEPADFLVSIALEQHRLGDVPAMHAMLQGFLQPQ